MVAVRVHRHSVEVLAKAPATASTFRQDLEAAFEDEGTAQINVHRHAVEVLAKTPATAQAYRQDLEAAFEDEGTAAVRVHRHVVEVLVQVLGKAAMHRQDLEAAFEDDGSAQTVRVHRHAVEVLGRASIFPVVPLPYPTGLDYFLQNWATQVQMETRYLTDITRSPITGAEERTGLLQRPERQIVVTFLHEGVTDLDRLFVTLRRLTRDQVVLPIFQDALFLDTSGTGQDNLFGDFTNRRFFDGARVAVFPGHPASQAMIRASEVDVYTIQKVFSTLLEVDRNLDQAYPENQFICVPLMDLELALEPEFTLLTDDTVRVTLTLNESLGKNSLPPSFTGQVPSGWRFQLGLPVLEIDSNWTNGLATSYRRYGQRRLEGRKNVVVPEGDRYVQVQEFKLQLERARFWDVLNLFDSRRGRLEPFWEVDNERLWKVLSVSPQFVDVEPFGEFSDFQADFSQWIGIVMTSGAIHVRQINTIQDVGTWRITIVAGNDLPTIDVNDIERFSRVRKKRFDEDVLAENWHTTDVVETSFKTVEVLNEKDVDI